MLKTIKLKFAEMSSNKKLHIISNDEMQESDEDLSGEEESDEGEGISAGNEVKFVATNKEASSVTLRIFLGGPN